MLSVELALKLGEAETCKLILVAKAALEVKVIIILVGSVGI